tara:strand:+ start:2421 stop:2711 length:291 start_codon:yes stop_codon:yes gene_type:complete
MDNKLRIFLTQLENWGIDVECSCDKTSDNDAAVYLAGRYEGIHIQIGATYYAIVLEAFIIEENAVGLVFITGAGDVRKELEVAFAAPLNIPGVTHQ